MSKTSIILSDVKDDVEKLTFLCGSPEPLLQSTIAHLQKVFPLIVSVTCDHICYRVSTLQRYSEIKSALETFATLKNESLVNGRPICIFRLKQTINFAGISIDCIELPAPKTGSPHPEGWEHIEVVVNEPLEQFMKSYPRVSFDTTALYKKINPEVAVNTPQGFRIKFHEKHILDVIKDELSCSL